MYDLNNQKILLTGASKGIGHAIAVRLLEQGATVGLHYRNTKQGVEQLRNKYGDKRAYPIKADLEDLEEIALLFRESLNLLHHLDTVIVNAGIFEPHDIDDELDSWFTIWQRTMRVNLDAAGILTKLCIEHFKKRGEGRLIYIGSRAAFRGETEEYLAYAASKGGLTSLAKSVARSFGKYNIKAFVVAPGFTRTEMAMNAISKIGEEQVLQNLSLNRLTAPEDIAPLIAFMSSGQMDHATGTTIDLNAGSHIR
ncbi:MAG: SDR family NAD(P)-dependent oxidoreductase [Flavobacteriaceae bacterium]